MIKQGKESEKEREGEGQRETKRKRERERKKEKERKIIEEDKDLPMWFSKNINITKDLVEKYGSTQNCYGCKFAKGEISDAKGHNDECRKRFMDLSEQARQ